MITGTVKFFNTDKGYGFIAPEGGGDDAFVHISAVERAGMHTLNKDQRVSYELETDRRGKTSAVNLTADRKSVVSGKSVSVSVDHGGRRTIKQTQQRT